MVSGKSPRLEVGSSIHDIINQNKSLSKSWEIWTPARKKKALFIAGVRRKIQELIYNVNLTDTEVARQITSMGLKIDRERIRQIRVTKQITKETKLSSKVDLIQVYKIIIENPQITYAELAKKFNVSYAQIVAYCHYRGVHLRNALHITPEERKRIDNFFHAIGIYKTPKYRKDVSAFVERYVLYSELGIVVEDNPNILVLVPSTVLSKIEEFDNLGIDWKENSHLFRISLDRLRATIKLFNSVGATHKLDSLLYYIYQDRNLSPFDNKKYVSLKEGIIKKDYDVILKWIPGFVRFALNKMGVQSISNEHIEIGRDAAIEVLTNCKSPENNQNLILLMISYNIGHKLRLDYYKTKKERSLEEYREVYDPNSETEVGLDLDYKDD